MTINITVVHNAEVIINVTDEFKASSKPEDIRKLSHELDVTIMELVSYADGVYYDYRYEREGYSVQLYTESEKDLITLIRTADLITTWTNNHPSFEEA